MKRLIRISAPLLSAVGLAACVTNAGLVESWQGKTLDDLIFAWGPPTSDTKLADGRRVIAYTHTEEGDSRIETTGNITRVVRDSNRTCSYVFRSNPAGIVTSFNRSGHPAACQRILWGKPGAPGWQPAGQAKPRTTAPTS